MTRSTRRQFLLSSGGLACGFAGCLSQETTSEGSTETPANVETRADFRFYNETGSELTLTMTVMDTEANERIVQRSYQLAPSTQDGDVVGTTIEELRDALYTYRFTTDIGHEATRQYGPSTSEQLRVRINPNQVTFRAVA
jgi:hypothetical protein